MDISIYPEENIAEDDVKNIDDLVNFLEQDIETELSLRDDWPELLSKVKKPKELKWHDWKLAIILKTEAEKAIIGFEDGTKGKIPVNYLKWTRTLEKIFDEETQKYKEEKSEEVTDTNQIFKKGDVIIVKKYGNPKNNNYALRQIPDVSGAMVVMNPHNGDILALVGGYNDDKIEFNNATQALRQPGSIIKPFTYLAALEKGFMPNKILIDDEVRMKKEDGTSWIPKNYSGKFYGPTTMRIGLEKSRNVVTVRLAEIVGLGRIAEVIERLGVNTAPEKNYSMILGASESNLLKITNAYAMIANGGKKVKPNFIKKINDNNGNIIYKNNKQECLNCKLDVFADNSSITRPEINEEIERVMDEKTAYQMISLLEGVVQRGTGWRAKHLKKPIGGKTGTTNDSFDAWFVGFSSDLVIGVWVGYDKPISLGMHATGSSVTLPVFVKFLKNVISEENAKPFNIPKGIKFAKIDRLTGQKPTRNTNKEDIIFESFKEENYSKIFHTIEDNDKLSPRDDDYSPPIIF